ncbi:MAG: hypothetical protein ACHQET_01420 [Chitinophagales bacterium]
MLALTPYGLNILQPQDKLNINWGKIFIEDFTLPKSSAIDSNSSAEIIADLGNTGFAGNKEGWFNYVFKKKTRIKILDKRGLDAATIQVLLYSGKAGDEKLMDLTGKTYNLENGKIP